MIEAHDLVHELPEYKELIHTLKMTDGHFARLFEDYHTLNKDIHRIEVGAEAASDERLEDLKKKRLEAKDELFAMLQKAAA